MPKKILFESAVHQLAWAGKRRLATLAEAGRDTAELRAFLRSLEPRQTGPKTMLVSWTTPAAASFEVDFAGARFYQRGDSPTTARVPAATALVDEDDPIERHNRLFFDQRLNDILAASGMDRFIVANRDRRFLTEEAFHDEWGDSVDVSKIDVRRVNTACTSPEMRFIRSRLGDVTGKRILDVGCGLGEAGVYFATLGADVTLSDLSSGMLRAAQRLADYTGVRVRTHHGPAETMVLAENERFDVIYVGNTLHHVDIAQALDHLLPLLKPDGIFVSWDPVHYNPLINVYRRLAREVRTPDEHPLTAGDIQLVATRFERVEKRFFWLFTLFIFVYMFVVQRRNPGKERYWKAVVADADRWKPVYVPLEKLDDLVLRLVPPLGYLCWNVVLIGRGPRLSRR